MTTDTSDLFMHHHQSCIIEELHEPEAQEPTSTQHTDVASEPAGASSSAGGPEQQQGDTVLLQQTSADADADAAAESQGDAAVAGPSDGATNDAAPSSSGAEQPVLTPEQQQLLEDCERLKQEGNAAYARGEYDEALQLYWQAIDQAPEGAQQRAVYLCNAAAAYIKKEMWQAAVEQCAAALSINDTYLKALMRRAQALQQLDDLEHALADAQRVLELDPGNSWATALVQQLQPEVQQRQEKMKEEMIGKLKDLGNSLLGKIGLSLDNFQAEQDPATGGYSIKFVQ